MTKSKKKLSSDRTKQKSRRILLKALKKMHNDWEVLLKKNKLAEDKNFLNRIAKDILELENNVVQYDCEKGDHKDTSILHEILEQPNNSDFVKTSLLDAAIAFKYQDPLCSDLCLLLKNITHYSSPFDDERLTILWSLSETLEKEKK